jgi:hypothetical protein
MEHSEKKTGNEGEGADVMDIDMDEKTEGQKEERMKNAEDARMEGGHHRLPARPNILRAC